LLRRVVVVLVRWHVFTHDDRSSKTYGGFGRRILLTEWWRPELPQPSDWLGLNLGLPARVDQVGRPCFSASTR
jgi:hypothetical protein